MSLNDNRTISETPDVDPGHPDGGNRPPSLRVQKTYQHPQIRSAIAKHCEQLSSGLTDIFKTEVEREVKKRVSEVIFSEATAHYEQLRLKDEALLVAETRCKDLQEQLELSKKECCQLRERVGGLEATETELKNALNERLGAVRPFRLRFFFFPFTHFLHGHR